MSKVMEQMSASVNQMDQSSQSAASAQELAQMAIDLRELVGKFKTGEEGKAVTSNQKPEQKRQRRRLRSRNQ